MSLASIGLLALCGCASGGGGGETLAPGPVASSPPPAPTTPPQPAATPPAKPTATAFVSWGLNPAPVLLTGLGRQLNTDGTVTSADQTLTLTRDSQNPAAWIEDSGHLLVLYPGMRFFGAGNFSAIDGVGGAITFASMGDNVSDSINYLQYADPSGGLNYQTFGWWYGSSGPGPALRIGSFSVGAATPGAAIPAAGSASFKGELTANNGTAIRYLTAAMSLDVNFATRSANFSSTNWVDWNGGLNTPVAGTALSGLLTYGAQQNALTGALTSADGRYSGGTSAQFYGPTAQEVGGVFNLTGPANEKVLGAFGAKR